MKLRISVFQVTANPTGPPVVAQISPAAANLVASYPTPAVFTLEGDVAVYDIPLQSIDTFTNVGVQASFTFSEEVRYTNEFKVWGYDLGNNTTTENAKFEIYLVEPGVLFPAFIAYREPATENIYLYKSTTSVADETVYTINGAETSGTSSIIAEDQLANITMTMRIYEKIQQNCRIVFGALLEEETTLSQRYARVRKHFSNHELDYAKPPCDDCTNTEAPTKITVTMTYDDLAFYNVDDTTVYFIDQDRIDLRLFTVFNPTGIANHVLSYHLPAYPSLPLTTQLEWQYQLNVVGDYLLTSTKLSSYNNKVTEQCDKQINVKNCRWHTFFNGECNDFTINNWSNVLEATVEIQQMQNDGTFKTIRIETVGPIASQEFLLDDGAYNIRVYRNKSVQYNYPYSPHCNLEQCLREIMENVLCTEGCPDAKPINNLSVILLNTHYYLGKLERYLDFSRYFEVLTNEATQDLFELHKVLGRLQDYCAQCKELDCGC